MASDHNSRSSPIRFQSVRQNQVPRGRKGKHKEIIGEILRHLDRLPADAALKLSLASVPATKAQIRAALNRATHKTGLPVATSSDSTYLYMWKVAAKS